MHRERVYRAVIADDVADLRYLLWRALESSGRFDVVGQAATGAEAIRVAAEQRPDVTLLDLGMPEMNGLEALPEIRSAVPDGVVVVLSGFDPADMEPAARERGAAGYIVKGPSPAEVTDQLLALLDGLAADEAPSMDFVGAAEAADITLPAALTSASQARTFVSTHLSEWRLDQLLDTALLLTSELVANAVVHASSPVRLTIRRAIDRLRVEVVDIGGGALRMEEPDLEATRGRGLLLMDALAAAWGTTASGGGKLVWFELPAQGQRS